jgi:hypothetical protein
VLAYINEFESYANGSVPAGRAASTREFSAELPDEER